MYLSCDVVWCGISVCFSFFFFKQKTAYEMRISDWSSDVCSSDLHVLAAVRVAMVVLQAQAVGGAGDHPGARMVVADVERHAQLARWCVAAAHVHDQRLAALGSASFRARGGPYW